jgi:hypothetical protein
MCKELMRVIAMSHHIESSQSHCNELMRVWHAQTNALRTHRTGFHTMQCYSMVTYALHLESYMDEMGDIIIGYQRGELYH